MRSEIERAVTTLLEQDWRVGEEVRFTDPQAGTSAPRVGTIVSVQPTTVKVNIGDRVVSVEKSKLSGATPELALPEPAPAEFEPTLPVEPDLTTFEPSLPQSPGHRDFRDDRTRAASSALGRIRLEVDELLSEISAHRDAGDWDLELADLPDYSSRIRAVDQMIGQLFQ